MKHIFLLIIVLLHSSCLTQKTTVSSERSWSDLLRSETALVLKNKTFENEIEITKLLESHLIKEGLYGVTVTPSITFVNCVFEKVVSACTKTPSTMVVTTFMGNLSFQDCTFKQAVNFRGGLFYGKTVFTNSTFKAESNFEETSFYQAAYFNGCKFEEELRFQNSFFMQQANFMNASFFGAVSFQSSVFNSVLQFGVGKFQKYADFSLVDCRGNVFFTYAEFMDRAGFSNGRYHGDVDIISTLHHKTNFRGCKFMGNVRFFKSTIQEELNFEDCFFLFGVPSLDFLPEEKLKFS